MDLQDERTLAERRHLMPEKEWNTIVQYHQALATALEIAIQAAIDDLEDADEDDDIDEVNDISCTFDDIDDHEKKNIDEVLCDNTVVNEL